MSIKLDRKPRKRIPSERFCGIFQMDMQELLDEQLRNKLNSQEPKAPGEKIPRKRLFNLFQR